MEKVFTIEEIQDFYPEHAIIDTGHHYLVKGFFNFGDFQASAKIRKSLPLFKNGRPLLPTKPFHIDETDFSAAIGTSTDCLHVQGWFGDWYDITGDKSGPYLSFGDITKATVFFAVASYDQTQNWFRTGVSEDLSSTKRAIKFVKNEEAETGTGQDIWLLSTSVTTVHALWQRYVYQRQTVIEKSENFLHNNDIVVSFSAPRSAENAFSIPS